jgi:hypothetical protein
MQESWQYVSRRGDYVEVCSNETAGTDIRYNTVSKLLAALVDIITIRAYKCLEEMTVGISIPKYRKGNKTKKTFIRKRKLL